MSLRGEKAKAKAKAKLDDATLAADQEWEALKHASSTPAHKVSGMTPEERETGAAGAVSVLSLVSAVGDRKTALVGGVAANVLASSSLPSQAFARIYRTPPRLPPAPLPPPTPPRCLICPMARGGRRF